MRGALSEQHRIVGQRGCKAPHKVTHAPGRVLPDSPGSVQPALDNSQGYMRVLILLDQIRGEKAALEPTLEGSNTGWVSPRTTASSVAFLQALHLALLAIPGTVTS